MHEAKPIYDPATHYQIAIRGPIDVEWLQRFFEGAEIVVDEHAQLDDVTVLDVRTDQAGIVGLVRRMHSLGITIQQFRVIQPGS